MKKVFLLLVLCFQLLVVFAHERPVMVERQRKQESMIENAFRNGQITENEYNKLMKEQKYIKEAIATNDLDNHWTMLEHNMMIAKLNHAEKRIRRYLRNNEKW